MIHTLSSWTEADALMEQFCLQTLTTCDIDVNTVHDPDLKSDLEVKNLPFDGSPSRYNLMIFIIYSDCISHNVYQLSC